MSNIIKPRHTLVQFKPFTFPDAEVVASEILQALEAEKIEAAGEEVSDEQLRAAREIAEQQAQEIIAQAEQQADSIRREAKEKGRGDGLSQGKAEAQKELDSVLNNFRQTLHQLGELQKKVLKESEGEIVDLALEIARKIIGVEMALDSGTVAKVIRTALAKVGAGQQVSVRVSQEDFAYLRKSPPDFLSEVELVADPNVERGGAIIDTPVGSLDAQIKEQLVEIEKNLKLGYISAAEGEE